MRHYLSEKRRLSTGALKAIQNFPTSVKKEISKAILLLQKGVEELRIKDAAGIYRTFYLARLGDRILVFHAIIKKTQKTPQKEILLGQKRLKELLDG